MLVFNRYASKKAKLFDDAIYELRRDRMSVLSDLKIAELRLLVCYQEYCQLLQFESRDIALQQRQMRTKAEKSEIHANIIELQSRAQTKQV